MLHSHQQSRFLPSKLEVDAGVDAKLVVVFAVVAVGFVVAVVVAVADKISAGVTERYN